jgi:hypothetical protein
LIECFETWLPLAGEKAIRYRPASVSSVTATENVRFYMKLIPKNWAVFQHYKDRNPPWIKLHRETLNDRTFMTLPLASKALAPLMWLLASESKNGVFDGSVDDLMFRLHITKKEYEDGVKPLIDKGFFEIASGVLADCQQDARPETETETETKREKETEAKKSTRGSRLSADFVLPTEWIAFCQQERQDLNPYKVFDGFKDYWVSKAGAQGVKLDWLATWRNWVRNQKQVFKQADLIRTTVPSSSQRDPALAKLDEDMKNAKPNPEILAKIKEALKGKVA